MKAISRLLGRNWKLALGQRPVDPTFDSTRSCREFVFHVKNLNWKRRKKGQVSPLSGYREKVYNLKRGSLSSSTWWPILLSRIPLIFHEENIPLRLKSTLEDL